MSTTFCAQENLSVGMRGTDWLLGLQQEKKAQLGRKHRMRKIKVSRTKKHHGTFNSYNVNKEELENELASMPSNRPINWTRLANKIYVTKIKDNTMPLNAGHVIKQFAISNGICLEKLSSNEYLRQVRTSKKRLHTDFQFQLHVRQKFSKISLKEIFSARNFTLVRKWLPNATRQIILTKTVNCKKN